MHTMTRFRRIAMLGLVLGLAACTSRAPQQLRIAVADEPFEQQRAFACAEVCAAEQASRSSGSLFDCVRACPGVEVTEGDACTEEGANAICQGNKGQAENAKPGGRENAARRAIDLLRGLAHPSLRSVAMAR